MPMDYELSCVLNRRQAINDALDEGEDVKPLYRVHNVYTEFHEFPRKQIKQYEQTFKQ
ncbi:UNVERIFIED_CONTAM: hypothetical protein PYX00_001044 [Menopon gallinae]|uniref:Uncharacterized protein n=1 Tax=Menopon gallinae TaxID=328185 RepID=A0AAW2IDC2_9NEOP